MRLAGTLEGLRRDTAGIAARAFAAQEEDKGSSRGDIKGEVAETEGAPRRVFDRRRGRDILGGEHDSIRDDEAA